VKRFNPMSHTPTMQELFQRALDKIDRRIQNPAYAGHHAKEALWDIRKDLFEQQVPDTEEERRAYCADLDHCLRNMDRSVRRRRV
jgi:hypothetical protein